MKAFLKYLILFSIVASTQVLASEIGEYGNTVQEVIRTIGNYRSHSEDFLSLLPVQSRTAENPLPEGEEYAFPFCIHQARKELEKYTFPEFSDADYENLRADATELAQYYRKNNIERNEPCDSVTDSNPTTQSALRGFVDYTRNELPIIFGSMRESIVRSSIYHKQNQVRIIQGMVQENFRHCHQQMQVRHQESLMLSRKVYSLEVPSGYRIVENKRFNHSSFMGFGNSGFKAYVLEKIDDPGVRKVVFAGTDGLNDWIQNVNHGQGQFEQFKDEVLEGLEDFVAEGGDLQFTGHSLGGGLAQYFSYQLMQNFKEKYPNKSIDDDDTGEVHTVTWNAFGARERAERMFGSPLNEGLRDSGFDHATVHYTTRGDPVGAISEHTFGHRREINVDEIITRQMEEIPGVNFDLSSFENSGRTAAQIGSSALAMGRNMWRGTQNAVGRPLETHDLTNLERAVENDRNVLGKATPIWVDSREEVVVNERGEQS